MIASLACCLLLAAAPDAPAPAPEAASAPLPPEAIVLALREARIARISGDRSAERKILNRLIGTYPDDPTAIAGALQLIREDEPDSDAAHALLSKLAEILARPGQLLPLRLLQELAGDPSSTPDELARMVEILRAEPPDTADRADRLRLLAAVLERLQREDETVGALEQLAKIDPDPSLRWRLLDAYRSRGRWEDLLRLAGEIHDKNAETALAWDRMDALGALGRVGELVDEANAQIARFASREAPGDAAPLGPRIADVSQEAAPGSHGTAGKLSGDVAEAFYPTVFRLIDAGRRDAAKGLVDRLDAVTGGDPGVRRMRTMLFGTPDERIALLDAEEMKTLSSGNAAAMRAEADTRLVAKDYAAAYDLLDRIAQATPKGFGDDVAGWFNYGLAATETAHWKEAENAMTRVLALQPTMSRALAHRARARIMQERFDEGIADAKAALALEPDSKQAAYAMYLAYQLRGDTANAETWLKRSGAH